MEDDNKNGVPTHRFEDYEHRTDSLEIKQISRFEEVARAEYPHRHTFYEIFLLEQGSGTHIVDFERYPIEPNTLYFLFPGQVHFWQIESPLEGILMTFTEDFFLFSLPSGDQYSELDFFHRITGPPLCRLTSDQLENIKQLFQNIEEESSSDAFDGAVAMWLCLRMLIIKVRRILYESQVEGYSTKQSQLVRLFKKRVSENYLNQREVSAYAKELGKSESTFHEIVKKTLGKTPGQVIRDEIILEAKRHLAHTSLSVSEICYKLKFEDPSYFSRFFTRETGMNPKAFREQFGEKYPFFGE